MPMTGPRTFLSASSEYFLTKDEPRGVRRRFADRVAEDVARGSCQESTSDNANRPSRENELTALDSLEDNMIAVATREGGIKSGGRWDEECWKEMGDGLEKINLGIGLGSFLFGSTKNNDTKKFFSTLGPLGALQFLRHYLFPA